MDATGAAAIDLRPQKGTQINGGFSFPVFAREFAMHKDLTTAGVPKAVSSRALTTSTIAFTVCFAVWTIFSIIGVALKEQLGLSEVQFGLLVGTPVLAGSLVRVILGVWTDRYGGRLVYTLTMLAAAASTALLAFAQSYEQLLVAALGVGIAGGSFAVGVANV